MDILEFVGEPEKTTQMVTMSVINMAMSRIFPKDLLEKLKIRLEVQVIQKWSKEEPTVEVFEDPNNGNVFGIMLLSRMPAPGEDNRAILKDMYSLLSINLIVCRLKMQGRLMFIDGREYFDGSDITEKDVDSLPYMRSVLDETEENLDYYMAWLAKHASEFFL